MIVCSDTPQCLCDLDVAEQGANLLRLFEQAGWIQAQSCFSQLMQSADVPMQSLAAALAADCCSLGSVQLCPSTAYVLYATSNNHRSCEDTAHCSHQRHVCHIYKPTIMSSKYLGICCSTCPHCLVQISSIPPKHLWNKHIVYCN